VVDASLSLPARRPLSRSYEREGFEDAWTRYFPSSPPLSRNNRNNPHEQSDCDPFESRNNTPLLRLKNSPQSRMDTAMFQMFRLRSPRKGKGSLT